MKRELKIFSLLTFFILFGSLFSQIGEIHKNDILKVSENIQSYEGSSSISTLHLWLTPPAESSITFYNKISDSYPDKSLLNRLAFFSKTSEDLLFSFYSQYINYSENLFIGLPKTDIIFPFHSFS